MLPVARMWLKIFRIYEKRIAAESPPSMSKSVPVI